MTYYGSTRKNWSESRTASQIYLPSGDKTLPKAPPHPTGTAIPGVPSGSYVSGANYQVKLLHQTKVHPRDRPETGLVIDIPAT